MTTMKDQLALPYHPQTAEDLAERFITIDNGRGPEIFFITAANSKIGGRDTNWIRAETLDRFGQVRTVHTIHPDKVFAIPSPAQVNAWAANVTTGPTSAAGIFRRQWRPFTRVLAVYAGLCGALGGAIFGALNGASPDPEILSIPANLFFGAVGAYAGIFIGLIFGSKAVRRDILATQKFAASPKEPTLTLQALAATHRNAYSAHARNR